MKDPKLVVSIDRINSKPPSFVMKDGEKISFEQSNFTIHTDQSLWELEENRFQGGICLSDCTIGTN